MALNVERPSRTVDGDEAYEIIASRRERYQDAFRVEPLDAEFPGFARTLGHRGIWLARADDNIAGTFKIRGATTAIVEAKERGIRVFSTASAGNHLSGCAAALDPDMFLHGGVPVGAAMTKINNAVRLAPSGTIQIHQNLGNTVDETIALISTSPEYGEYIAPFDNQNVIKGQGTLVDDILKTHPYVGHIGVPVGGAGLVAGILNRLDELGRKDVTVYAIEAEGSNSLSESLINREPTAVEQPNRRYGGSAVSKVGRHTFALCQKFQERLEIFTVTDEEVDTLIDSYETDRHEHELEHIPAYEPTTLVAIAGLAHIARKHPVNDIVVIGTGHNDTLRPRPKRYATRIISGTFHQ